MWSTVPQSVGGDTIVSGFCRSRSGLRGPTMLDPLPSRRGSTMVFAVLDGMICRGSFGG